MNLPRRFAVLAVSTVSLLAAPALVLLMFDNHANTVSGTSRQASEEDWGDAPPPYPQQAHHLLPPLSAIWMGDPMSPPDGESGPQPDPNGLGDDHAGTDDEEGVVFGTLIPCQASSVWVQASGPDGILNGWIDYDDDGNWSDPGEHVVVNQPLVPGQNTIPLAVPCNARPTRQTFTRFRLSTGPTDYQDAGVTQSLAGEVEDQAVPIQGPDLSVVKTDDHDPAVTGDILVYTVSVTNNGPVNEPAAVIYDTIPDDLTVIAAVPGQGTCNILSSPLRCQLGLIPVSGVVNVIIKTRVGGGADGDITNHVLVEGNGPDPDASNNQADETTTIHQQGLDVDVIKSDFPDPVWSMDPITYTLSVHNHGAQPALAVQITDTLPAADVDFAGTVATPSQGMCTPQGQPEILCNLGDIAAGSSASVVVSVPRVLRVPPDFGTAETIYNTATVSLDPNDLAPENNVDVEATTVVSPCVEVMLVIDKSGTMLLRDGGGNTRFEDAQNAAKIFVQSVDPLVTKIGLVWFNNLAHLAHPLSRDMASVTAAINGMAPPSLGDSTAMGLGVIEARNELDGTRHNPLATRAMVFLSDGSNGTGPPPIAEAAIAKGMGIRVITIGLGNLLPNEEQVLIDMSSPPRGYFKAPTSDQLEGIYANLGAGICETHPPSGPQPLDLAITKLDAPYDPSPICGVITYTLAITNLTQGVMAENVVVTDTLPAGVTFVGAVPTAGGQPPRCAQSADLAEVNCELGDLAGGASTSVLIALRLTDPMQSPPILSIDNSARVACDNPETNEENNVDDESTSFVLNDLILTKVADPATLTPPGWITYTLTVTSTGACDNPNVLVTDTLPAAFRYRGSVTSLGVAGYAAGLHAVTATLGLMHDNEVATIAITGTIPCTATGTLTNTAITTGMMPESDLANNTDSATTVLGLARCSDLGDAPDRYNHSMAPMTAYVGVFAIFPTVYERSVLQPPGPKHRAAKDDAWLGLSVSGENEADIPPDDDPDTNISPSSNIANRDGHDDGANPGIIAVCGPTLLTYKIKVSNLQGTQPRTRYTNVWYDFNRDGDFADTFVCTSGNGGSPQTVKEWAVRNDPSLLGPGIHNLSTPMFVGKAPTGLNKIWMRITLSDTTSPLQGDGRGPAGGYLFGETEDYLVGSGGLFPFYLTAAPSVSDRAYWPPSIPIHQSLPR